MSKKICKKYFESCNFSEIYEVIKINEYFYYKPINKIELQNVIDLYLENRGETIKKYGIMNEWDVSNITDLSQLFKDKKDFNEDISDWDVSNVKNMCCMFFNAKK